MPQTLEATFDGKVFRPAGSVALKPDTQVELVVTVKNLSDNYRNKSFLQTAASLELDGPEDFSTLLDDYLYEGKKL